MNKLYTLVMKNISSSVLTMKKLKASVKRMEQKDLDTIKPIKDLIAEGRNIALRFAKNNNEHVIGVIVNDSTAKTYGYWYSLSMLSKPLLAGYNIKNIVQNFEENMFTIYVDLQFHKPVKYIPYIDVT